MSKKYTYEEVKDYIESFGYKLLSKEYINNRTKLKLACDKGHQYETRFSDFKNMKSRCPYCSKKHKYSYEEVKEYIGSFGYELLSKEYKNSQTKLLMKCPNGHTIKMIFNSFKNENHRCPYCQNKVKLTYEEVKNYIESFDYKLLSEEYKNSNEKIKVKCPNPNHEPYYVTFNHFKSGGSRCPVCNISKGEQRIMDWLNNKNVEYFYEKTFYGLYGINGGNLSYDFYLPDYNLLIEYQGEQHEHQCGIFGNFERQQEHDKRKREYAKNNNISLLEIWYWDFDNIEEILKEMIK